MTEQPENPLAFPVDIQLERWAGPRQDQIEVLDTVTISIEQVVAELDADRRKDLVEQAAEGVRELDWIYERAVDLGLIAYHDGPYTVDLEPLHEWLQDNPSAMNTLPHRPYRVVTVGKQLTSPVTSEQALADADENGFLTALIQVPFDDLLAAHASRDDQYDEHDLLASKVSPLVPYASEYRVVGLVHDPDGNDQPDLLVLFTNNVVEAAASTSLGQSG